MRVRRILLCEFQTTNALSYDMQTTVNQFLPDILLVFSFTVMDGSLTYGGEGSVCDSFTNKTVITFNHTQSYTEMWVSDSGKVICVAHVSDDWNYYVMVINSDGTDTPFTSMAATFTAGTVSISTHPGSCFKGQTPGSKTSNSNNVTLYLLSYAINNYTESIKSATNVNAIIVGFVTPLIIIAVLVIAFLLYRKYYRRNV